MVMQACVWLFSVVYGYVGLCRPEQGCVGFVWLRIETDQRFTSKNLGKNLMYPLLLCI